MIALKWFLQHQRQIFGFLLLMCLCFLLLQYRYNYSAQNGCDVKDIRSLANDESLQKIKKEASGDIDYFTPNLAEPTVSQTTTPSPCHPKHYVLFLKTHKTGSSTITNILNRFADKHNMSILLPKGTQYYSFDWPNKFRLSFAQDTHARPNFLANHARYSRKSMNVLFPRETTTYISVLRHPVSQWESTFQYMSFPYILQITNMDDPLDFFLNNLPTSENIQEIARRYPSLYLIRNPLFFDLGLDHRYYDNVTYIRRALKTLNDDFDVVLIMEHFDESLTLLRRRLCWEIDDVVYFKMNERLSKHKRRVLTETQIDRIKNWNNADMVLYNHFVEKFWKEVKNEGPGFYDDVIELRKRRDLYTNLCIEREAVEEAYSSVFVKGYKMRSNITGEILTFCERMLKNEIHFMDYFRAKRRKWTNQLEGINIENFENSREELEIFVDAQPQVKTSTYRYGKPTPVKPNMTLFTPVNVVTAPNQHTTNKMTKNSKVKAKRKKVRKTFNNLIDELERESEASSKADESDRPTENTKMEDQSSDIILGDSIQSSNDVNTLENKDLKKKSSSDLQKRGDDDDDDEEDNDDTIDVLKYDGKTIIGSSAKRRT